MASARRIKTILVMAFMLFLGFWLVTGTLSFASEVSSTVGDDSPETLAKFNQDDYVGSETCAACHDDAFQSFSETKHAKLKDLKSYKVKPQGCESCHGPGKKHVDDPSVENIISFKNKTSKQISQTCLSCHSGEDDHNKFVRSDHWRNNVGCTDCHTAHGAPKIPTQIGSTRRVGLDSEDKPGSSTLAMLKRSEPQLCLSCHNGVRSHFNKPFRHKVLEGVMKCSDCHNAHGGFELKNARLSVGADTSCVKCHTDKQGPFVYEHLPITTEGCATCHNTHGSSNPKMLRRSQVRQLCLECHSSITESLAPGVPSFHDQRNVRTQNCTTCHAKIHGSQSHPAFFR